MEIEQAIFTSLAHGHRTGYHLAAASAGLAEVDARELAVWGPSHDSLWQTAPGTSSVNYHPLPSGTYCVSRTVASGEEYSGRGGLNIYTHCLVLRSVDLERFGNNPFAVLTAAAARGAFQVRDPIPERLERLRLLGRTTTMDVGPLRQVAAEPGAEHFASFLEVALGEGRVALCAGDLAEPLVRALFACLPRGCRRGFSFSTGLRCSPSRPFRIVGLPKSHGRKQRAPERYGLVQWQMGAEPRKPCRGWPRFVYDALNTGRYDFLSRVLQDHPGEIKLISLEHLGERFREQMRTATHSEADRESEMPGDDGQRNGDSTQFASRLANQLRRSPDDPELWNMVRNEHSSSLESENTRRATDLAIRVCQVFAARGRKHAQASRERVRELFEQQIVRSPATFSRTRRRLSKLKPVFDRDGWLELANEVESNTLCRSETAASSVGTTPSDLSPDANGQQAGRRPAPADAAQELSALSTATVATESTRHTSAVERLEQLDDTVFAAVAGDSAALASLRQLWPATLDDVGAEDLEESRLQYVRHAMATWRQCVAGEEIRNPTLAVAVAEVLSILLSEANRPELG